MSLEQQDRYVLLERLAEELIGDQPEESFVRECMESVGLEYTEDFVTRINSVLEALQFECPRIKIQGEKKSNK